MDYLRHAKGAVVVVVATAACHGVMSGGYAGARDAAGGDAGAFSGGIGFLLTTLASWVLMPVLLWAGMNLVGETGNAALLVICGLVWLGVSGYFIDDIDRSGGHIPIPALVAYVLLGAALAVVGTDEESD
ncbi:hypothetical protein ACFV85_08915 [Streptomyces niveus]|uniref:hypothetical protein n=1 Tax=Streptomyces niveus TaxID=193462 RepID=UPI003658253D